MRCFLPASKERHSDLGDLGPLQGAGHAQPICHRLGTLGTGPLVVSIAMDGYPKLVEKGKSLKTPRKKCLHDTWKDQFNSKKQLT